MRLWAGYRPQDALGRRAIVVPRRRCRTRMSRHSARMSRPKQGALFTKAPAGFGTNSFGVRKILTHSLTYVRCESSMREGPIFSLARWASNWSCSHARYSYRRSRRHRLTAARSRVRPGFYADGERGMRCAKRRSNSNCCDDGASCDWELPPIFQIIRSTGTKKHRRERDA